MKHKLHYFVHHLLCYHQDLVAIMLSFQFKDVMHLMKMISMMKKMKSFVIQTMKKMMMMIWPVCCFNVKFNLARTLEETQDRSACRLMRQKRFPSVIGGE